MIDDLRRIAKGDALSQIQSRGLMKIILDRAAEPEQIGALLGLLHSREISSEVLAGFAEELDSRRLDIPVSDELRHQLVDVCGTGGDSSLSSGSTFNVSTTVSILAASCGLPIAKHGNRAVSSRSGSFDVLEALGIAFSTTPESAADSLEKDRIAFLFAPIFHPSMQEIVPIRRALGFRTVFNALGPLLNPARVKRQLVGVFSKTLVIPMIEALKKLGATDAIVVHGEDGLDEFSLCASTYVARLENGEITTSLFSPKQLGLKLCTPHDIQGGDPRANAEILESILAGESGPRADLVCLNTAAALVVGGLVNSMEGGFERASSVQKSGAATQLLQKLRETNLSVPAATVSGSETTK